MKTINNQEHVKEKWSKKNDPITIDLSVWSKEQLLWNCKNGHEYKSRPEHIYKRDRQCPYCSGRCATSENNLLSKHPNLTLEWDYEKNVGIPESTLPRSGVLVYWKCKNGHSWKASPHNRTTNQGCPYCANKKVDEKNSFLNDGRYYHILKEWDYDNNIILPSEVVPGSAKRIHWKCQHGHKWDCQLRQRVKCKSFCPFCKKIELNDGEFFESYVEAHYYLMLKEKGIQFIKQKRYPNSRMRCDFYLLASKTYVELTSYTKNNAYSNDITFYIRYLRKIAKKKKMAKLCGKRFEFIQKVLTKNEVEKIVKLRVQR